MVKRFLTAVFVAAILFSTTLTGHAAGGISLELSRTEAKPGDYVTASGTAGPLEWVSVKVLDEADNIVFYEPTKSDAQGKYSLNFRIPDMEGETLTVVSGYGDTVKTAIIYIESDTGQENNAPVLNRIGNKAVKEGSRLEFTVSASDSDNGDVLVFSVQNLPEGAVFSAQTGKFSWTPNRNQAGVYGNIRFIVSDGEASDDETITITVDNVGSHGGGHGNSNNPAPTISAPAPTTPAPALTPNAPVKLAIAVDAVEVENKRANVSINGKELSDALTRSDDVIVEIPHFEGVESYSVNIPAEVLSAGQNDFKISVKTQIGTVTMPAEAFRGMNLESSSSFQLEINSADKSLLDEGIRQQLGNRPVINIGFKVDGESVQWSNPEAPITVSIPYTPTEEELSDIEHIVVWFIGDDGSITAIPSGRYDPGTGLVTFSTVHLSQYAVAYSKKEFKDISEYPWAKKAIEVLAAKGVINGTGAGNYSPADSITRGDFVLMLVKTLGLTAGVENNFSDIPRTAYYYEAAGVTKKLGITEGVGENMFSPQSYITRQDMMTMIYKAMKAAGKTIGPGDEDVLKKFGDRSKISPYAVDSLTALVGNGIVSGTGTDIEPWQEASRAETAVLLYRVYHK